MLSWKPVYLISSLLCLEITDSSREIVNNYKARIAANDIPRPVLAIPLEAKHPDRDLILSNGHHRSRAYYELGRKALPGIVCTQDDDLRRLRDLGAAYGMRTLDEFRDFYYSRVPSLSRQGVLTVATMRLS